MSAVADQFRQSEDLFEEAVADSLPGEEEAPVDPEQPGFGSLLTLLRAAQDGGADMTLLAVYHNALSDHLDDVRDYLAALEVAEPLRGMAAPVLDATHHTLGRMEEVLGLLGDFLETAEEPILEDAVALLESVHGEVRAGF